MSNGDMLDSCFMQFKLDYSGTKSLAIGNAVVHDVSVGGHPWRIRCFPRGLIAEDKGEYVSVSLDLTGGSSGAVNAIFEAFVTKPDGAPSSSRAQRTLQVFRPPRRQMCGVIVVRGEEGPLHVPPSDIGGHLGLLLDCADGSDVSFVVDGEKFPAHRAVLAARSPVFKAQLLGPTARAKTSPVTVHDMAPAKFRAMLRFMYTDACPADAELGDSSPPAEMFRRLLSAADRYALDRLKLVCASKLWDDVSADTVAVTLACAEDCRCPELKRKCIGFLVDEKNFRDAVLTDGFVQLVQKFPSIIAELKEAGK